MAPIWLLPTPAVASGAGCSCQTARDDLGWPATCVQEEASKASKLREQTAAKLLLLERQKGDVEQKRDALKAEVTGLEREIELAHRQIDVERRKQEEMVKERER